MDLFSTKSCSAAIHMCHITETLKARTIRKKITNFVVSEANLNNTEHSYQIYHINFSLSLFLIHNARAHSS
jgi:hypothetical protein